MQAHQTSPVCLGEEGGQVVETEEGGVEVEEEGEVEVEEEGAAEVEVGGKRVPVIVQTKLGVILLLVNHLNQLAQMLVLALVLILVLGQELVACSTVIEDLTSFPLMSIEVQTPHQNNGVNAIMFSCVFRLKKERTLLFITHRLLTG